MVHSMIRVVDEARSTAFYRHAFKLEVAERFDFDSFTLIYMSNAQSGFELELTVNKGTSAPYELGNGYGHLAVVVDDIEGEHTRLADLQPGAIKELTLGSRGPAKFFFLQDPDGYKIEVLGRGGRFQ